MTFFDRTQELKSIEWKLFCLEYTVLNRQYRQSFWDCILDVEYQESIASMEKLAEMEIGAFFGH